MTQRNIAMKLTFATAAVFGGAVAACSMGAPTAAADPALPPAPPYLWGAPYVYPGAFSYLPYYPYVYPKPTTDTRGVRTAGVVGDPTQTAFAMPNSKPGESLGQPNLFSAANARSEISGGLTPASPPVGGVNFAPSGVPVTTLENPEGTPPPPAGGPEAAMPAPMTVPTLEDPGPHPIEGERSDQ
jgi:hypothetical protein